MEQPGAPKAEIEITALLFAMQDRFERCLVEQVELRFVAEEAGLIDGEVFEQSTEFFLAFMARKQAIVVIERIESGGLQAAYEAVTQEMGAALIEVHAAFLIDKRLQQLQLGLSDVEIDSGSGHCVLRVRVQFSSRKIRGVMKNATH